MRHSLTYRLQCVIATSLALVACGGGSSSDEAPVGPCVHQYGDPVLHLDSALDAATGQPIATVHISSVVLNGVPADHALLLQGSVNAASNGASIVCTVPCGLSNSEGTYGFVASASGYAPQNATVMAKYATTTGGCPSSSSGGTAVRLELQAL